MLRNFDKPSSLAGQDCSLNMVKLDPNYDIHKILEVQQTLINNYSTIISQIDHLKHPEELNKNKSKSKTVIDVSNSNINLGSGQVPSIK